jgi:hypothetical protein
MRAGYEFTVLEQHHTRTTFFRSESGDTLSVLTPYQGQQHVPVAEGGVAGDVEGHGALVPRPVLLLDLLHVDLRPRYDHPGEHVLVRPQPQDGVPDHLKNTRERTRRCQCQCQMFRRFIICSSPSFFDDLPVRSASQVRSSTR